MRRFGKIKRLPIKRFAAQNRWSLLARAALNKYYADLLALRAAALGYWTLLSIVPLIAVAFSVLNAFRVESSVEAFLLQLLQPIGP